MKILFDDVKALRNTNAWPRKRTKTELKRRSYDQNKKTEFASSGMASVSPKSGVGDATGVGKHPKMAQDSEKWHRGAAGGVGDAKTGVGDARYWLFKEK